MDPSNNAKCSHSPVIARSFIVALSQHVAAAGYIRGVPDSLSPPSGATRQSRRNKLWAPLALGALIALAIAAILLFSQPTTSPCRGSICLPPKSVIGLHVPWAIGGPAIERDGTLSQREPEWPDVPVQGIRLWDTRTAWLNLEPRQDLWDFSNLDAHIEQARVHGVSDITLVLWGTPRWAASQVQPTDAPWLGPGSASMPIDLQDWRDYVQTVVSRYQGVITAYEVGNEPNVKAFWTGTDEQLAELVKEAAQIVHDTDSAALVVAPAPVVVNSNPQQTRLANKFWDSMNSQKNGDPLPASQRVDALSFHWYPTAQTKPIELKALVNQLRNLARQAGYFNTPLWLTEVNFYNQGLTADAQKQKVIRTNRWIRELKLPRAYWYAWTDLGPQEIMQFVPGSPAAQGLAASLGQ